ncbi:MAG: GGDEF domain-containing protein [Desulfovibrionaceae bacterium]|nr:GGDEF domain-containing protein [Desulfovibrionaceae bacterium]
MTRQRTATQLKIRYRVFYVLSIVALCALMCVNFGIVYTLLATPPEDPEPLLRLFYLTMTAGLLILAAQALLVLKRFVSILDRDSLAREEMAARLEELTVRDPLTKAFNRNKFEEVAARELNNVHRYCSDLSGIIFDVDGFRAINEEHGYKTGDKLLANLVHYLTGKLRNNDYLFRWRGGKFIILTPHTDVDKAAIVAEKLRQAVGHKIFGGKIRLTVSLGVVQAESEDTVEFFLQRLQAALAGAKNSGRNTVVILREGDIAA